MRIWMWAIFLGFGLSRSLAWAPLPAASARPFLPAAYGSFLEAPWSQGDLKSALAKGVCVFGRWSETVREKSCGSYASARECEPSGLSFREQMCSWRAGRCMRQTEALCHDLVDRYWAPVGRQQTIQVLSQEAYAESFSELFENIGSAGAVAIAFLGHGQSGEALLENALNAAALVPGRTLYLSDWGCEGFKNFRAWARNLDRRSIREEISVRLSGVDWNRIFGTDRAIYLSANQTGPFFQRGNFETIRATQTRTWLELSIAEERWQTRYALPLCKDTQAGLEGRCHADDVGQTFECVDRQGGETLNVCCRPSGGPARFMRGNRCP